jgi:hypothetical protein
MTRLIFRSSRRILTDEMGGADERVRDAALGRVKLGGICRGAVVVLQTSRVHMFVVVVT